MQSPIEQFKVIRSRLARYVIPTANTTVLIASVGTLVLLVYNFGFKVDISLHSAIHRYLHALGFVMLLGYAARLLFEQRGAKGKWIELILVALLFLFVWYNLFNMPQALRGVFHFVGTSLFAHILMALVSILEISRWSFFLLSRTINPSFLLVASFASIILIGTFMLLLPNATTKPLGFTDALFTATSAVCVTGLTVVDTATHFTLLGKVVIILLIQIGGIGIMTFTTFFAFFLSSSTFHSRVVMRELLSSSNLGEIYKILASIVLVTFVIETIGALLVYSSIQGTLAGYTSNQEVGFAIFHSISAFCNAGFSTLSGNLYDSQVSANYWLHTVVAILIIAGGMGFPIVYDYLKLFVYTLRNTISRVIYKKRLPQYNRGISINTRLAITTTITLLIVGMLLFFALEYSNTLQGLHFLEKVAVSFFNSVTPRTAGFSNLDLGHLLTPTLLVTIFLMWIGASPMSTGGGIKTTTFAVMILNMFSVLRGRPHIQSAQRVVKPEAVARAQAVIALSIFWLAFSIFLLSIFEPQASLMQIAFECVSALSTVGLSLNLSAQLGQAGKVLIMLTMFVGRVGLISILTGMFAGVQNQKYSYPEESIMT